MCQAPNSEPYRVGPFTYSAVFPLSSMALGMSGSTLAEVASHVGLMSALPLVRLAGSQDVGTCFVVLHSGKGVSR